MVSTLPTLKDDAAARLVDIDDSIHLYRGGWAARRLARLADLVVVGNSWLAEVWERWNPAIEILPTPVDTDHYAVRRRRAADDRLDRQRREPALPATIAPALERVVQRFPATCIGCAATAPELPRLPVHYVRGRHGERISLRDFDRRMPLADGPWERGKCSFKILQYMAAGGLACLAGRHKQSCCARWRSAWATTIDQ